MDSVLNPADTVPAQTVPVPLHRLAHGRTGDKGNRSNISVIAWRPEFWPLLVEQMTEALVAEQFAHRRPQQVRRYLLPQLQAMNFVLDEVLDGGVNDALNLDSHGKALSFLLLDLVLQVPSAWLPLLAGPPLAGPASLAAEPGTASVPDTTSAA